MTKLEEVYRKILHCLQSGQYKDAERICLFELGTRQQEDGQLLFYLGTAARMLNKHQAAQVAFDAALKVAPDNTDYLQASASTHEANQDYEAAYELMLRVLQLSPANINVRANLAVALERMQRHDEALEMYTSVLQADASQRTANLNRGTLLHKLERKREALMHNRLAHARLPDVFGTLYNLVDTLIANFEYQEALDYCEQGLLLQPRHAHLLVKKAIALSALSRRNEALAALSRARIIWPQVMQDYLPQTRHLPASISLYLDGEILEYEARYEEQQACYWRYRSGYLEKLRQAIHDKPYRNRALSSVENAFKIHSLDIAAQDRVVLMRHIANTVSDFAWLYKTEPFTYKTNAHNKIRIGYLSADFREHATAILSRQIYGLHDRNLFQVYGYSLHNAATADRYRMDIEEACDVFRDAAELDTADLARMINQDEIDILIDLAGYTAHSRATVMAMRPAPMQIQYLAFPSTMGADFIDYVLVDKQFCPPGKDDEWSEQPIRLPHSLYPYDNALDNSSTVLKRADFGLPDDGFVFCCFNNSYKIEPQIFERWMNILKAVPGGVLWLLAKHEDVQANLRREAGARGVDQSRLVFTGHLPLAQHLPRYQLADLFLDTYWVNAHTTGAEALWQGLPLISIFGEVPSARGAASILTALEMPELIVQDFDEYEQLAIFYATHPAEYAAMREKLKAKRYTAPMYNTRLTVRHIECAYQMAWARYQAGLPPEAMDVPEIIDPMLRGCIH